MRALQLSDLIVEVRDRSLRRVGMIRREDLDLELTGAFNNVGSWTLRLAADHPLAGALREPGSGILVNGPRNKILFSGPTIKPEFAATAADPAGTVTFEGVDDTVLLADRLAFPQPDNPDPQTQTQPHHILTGPVMAVMHGFVAANLGPNAPAPRRHPHLVMGYAQPDGQVVTKSARFPVLGTLLSELAIGAGVRFRIIQSRELDRDELVFETTYTSDATKEVRLDVANNTLAAQRLAISPPGATQVIVAGQGEMTDRTFLALTTPAAQAAEAAWGRRIERFVDQRNTNDPDELRQAGMEVLDAEGDTRVAAQAVPMQDTTMEFGRDWDLGDRVTVVVADQELTSTVTGYVLKASSDGVTLGALLGDPVGFDPAAALTKRVQQSEDRLSALERTAESRHLYDTKWNTPTLLNGWRSVGPPWQGPRYRKLPSGQVEIQGMVLGGTDFPVGTLPAGFRPGARLAFHTVADVTTRIDIQPDGLIYSWTTNKLISLNATFYADQ